MVNYNQEERKDYNRYGKKKRDPQKTALVQSIRNQYQPESVEDMQDALKDIFGPMFEAMLQGEMDNHLGYLFKQNLENIIRRCSNRSATRPGCKLWAEGESEANNK